MAEPSRQPFRFRLPWMINPMSNLTRPPAENQRATQPTATIPVLRTLRTPTVPLPPQPQPPPKTEPKPPSPARSGPQSGMASQPQPQSRAASQPPSPSRTAPPSPSRTTSPSQVASLPPSPPRTTLSQPETTQRTESQPPSPSRTISQTPLPFQTSPSQSQTPPRMLESKTAPLSQVSPRTTPQSQASSEPQSPSRTTPSQSQALPKMEFKPAPPSPSAPQTTPQPQLTSEPPSPSRTTPSQSQAPPRTESKPAPPTPTAPQSRMSSQPPSPSRASKTQSATRTVSQPSSPANTQRLPASRVPSKPSSPTRLASQTATRTSPQSPSSSSRTTTQGATIQTTSQPPSPSRQVFGSQIKTQAASEPPSPSKSSVSKPEPSSDKTAKAESAISHPLSQYPQPQVMTPQSQNQIQSQTASQQAEDKRQPSQVLGSDAANMSTSTAAPLKIPATQPLKSSVVPIDPKKHPNLEAETRENKEEKPKLESARKEDKHMTVVNEEPKQRKSTDFFNIAGDSNKQPQGWSSTTSQGKHNHLNKQVHGDDKDMAQESKTTTTTPQKDMNASSESQPQPPVSQDERATLHKEIKEGIFGVIHKLGAGQTTQGMDGPVSVITLTGENRGASMHVGAELARKEGPVHIHRGYKLNQDDKNEMTTDGESSSKRKSSNPITKEDEASTAYINSNVQSINNSIMSNSSMSERSPGVRWVLEHNQTEPVKKGNQKSVEGLEAHKADFNVTHSQKLTYKPTIRRRCLRGLLLEPSESDPDNPEKPRRHGCRYSCDAKKKCKDNGKEGTTIQ